MTLKLKTHSVAHVIIEDFHRQCSSLYNFFFILNSNLQAFYNQFNNNSIQFKANFELSIQFQYNSYICIGNPIQMQYNLCHLHLSQNTLSIQDQYSRKCNMQHKNKIIYKWLCHHFQGPNSFNTKAKVKSKTCLGICRRMIQVLP